MQSVAEGFRGNDDLRQPASPPDPDGGRNRNKGVRMEKGIGVGQMRNGNVEGNRAGAEGAHACPTARILARTAQAWEVVA